VDHLHSFRSATGVGKDGRSYKGRIVGRSQCRFEGTVAEDHDVVDMIVVVVYFLCVYVSLQNYEGHSGMTCTH